MFAGAMYRLSERTHKVCQRVQFCAHQAALLPPSCNHSVEEVKQHAEWHKRQGRPQVAGLVRRAKAVAHGELDRHDTAEAIHEGDEVREVVGANQAEVARILSVEEVGLLILGWLLLARGSLLSSSRHLNSRGCCATSLAVFSTPLGTPDLFDILAVVASRCRRSVMVRYSVSSAQLEALKEGRDV